MFLCARQIVADSRQAKAVAEVREAEYRFGTMCGELDGI